MRTKVFQLVKMLPPGRSGIQAPSRGFAQILSEDSETEGSRAGGGGGKHKAAACVTALILDKPEG